VAGQKTRAEAMEELRAPPYDPKLVAEDFTYLSRKFDLSGADFEAFMSAPVNGSDRYSNTAWLLQALAPVVR